MIPYSKQAHQVNLQTKHSPPGNIMYSTVLYLQVGFSKCFSSCPRQVSRSGRKNASHGFNTSCLPPSYCLKLPHWGGHTCHRALDSAAERGWHSTLHTYFEHHDNFQPSSQPRPCARAYPAKFPGSILQANLKL